MKKRSLGIILWIFFFPFYSFPAGYLIFSSDHIDTSFLQAKDYRAIAVIQKKYSSLNTLIQRRTQRMLERMEKKEFALQEALRSKDSAKAAILFTNTRANYDRLNRLLHSPIDQATPFPLKQYVAGADSTHTALRFLEQGSGSNPIAGSQLQKIQAASAEMQQVEGKLQQADDIKQFITQRERELTSQLSQYGLNKQLLGINKEAFYAQQQIVEYKSMINDKEKLEEAFLSRMNELPAFAGFMQKHSYLGQLFGLPADYGSPTALIGLQTKDKVQALLDQKIGAMQGNSANGVNPAQYAQQQVQQAQDEIAKLKDKLKSLGNSGGSGDLTMPDFSPNNQRTKSFMRRIIYGFNLQTQPTSTLLPATADIGLTLGYKLNDRTNFGIGGGYRLGVGNGLSHISFSNQGVNIRSYFEWRAKGSWWLSAGWEYNYMQAFAKWSTLTNSDIWQKTALIGLEKKYRIAKNKVSTLQLLFDALYRQHVPVSQPLVFRMGYEF